MPEKIFLSGPYRETINELDSCSPFAGNPSLSWDDDVSWIVVSYFT